MSSIHEMQRGALPYRLGTTSFVFRDDVLPNVRLLAPFVDDVEIVIYEYDGQSSLPDAGAMEELVGLAAHWGLTYTVHLPLDLRMASPNGAERDRSVRRASDVIAATAALQPWGWVLHAEADGSPESWPEWARATVESLTRLATTVEPRLLCLENLETQPPDEVLSAAERAGVSTCLDVGHLFKAGLDAAMYLGGPLNRARVVHLHGWDGKADHRSLAVLPRGERAAVSAALLAGPYRGVATIEVFSLEDLVSSYRVLNMER